MPRCFMLEAISKCSRKKPKWAYAKWLIHVAKVFACD